MRLGYFTMPMHPMGRPWAETLREDRETVILADRLGFHDAFVGEHLTDQLENIPNSMLFLASLISDTRTIKLATGTSNLSYTHPVLIASNAALLDTLAQGRFILGISAGNIPSDAEVLGHLDLDRNQMFAEAIDVILEIWARDPPYDIDLPGNRFKVSTRRTSVPALGLGALAKPFQKPRPEIVGTVVAPFSKGVVLMGERDFHPLSANFLMPRWVKTHWQNYAEGKAKAGLPADPAEWRIARTVFVADDEATALRYGKGADSPYRFYYRQLKAKFDRARRTIVWKDDPNQPDDTVTEDSYRRSAGDLRHRRQGGGRDPGLARGGRRIRRARLCRHGLGRRGAHQALDGADGGARDAARQRRDRKRPPAATGSGAMTRTP